MRPPEGREDELPPKGGRGSTPDWEGRRTPNWRGVECEPPPKGSEGNHHRRRRRWGKATTTYGGGGRKSEPSTQPDHPTHRTPNPATTQHPCFLWRPSFSGFGLVLPSRGLDVVGHSKKKQEKYRKKKRKNETKRKNEIISTIIIFKVFLK